MKDKNIAFISTFLSFRCKLLLRMITGFSFCSSLQNTGKHWNLWNGKPFRNIYVTVNYRLVWVPFLFCFVLFCCLFYHGSVISRKTTSGLIFSHLQNGSNNAQCIRPMWRIYPARCKWSTVTWVYFYEMHRMGQSKEMKQVRRCQGPEEKKEEWLHDGAQVSSGVWATWS